MTRRNILVVTDDSLGARMAGPAIRAWNIAEVLAADHDVRLASTRSATSSSPLFAVCDGSGARLRGLAEGMDVIVLQGFTLYAHPWLADLGAHLVLDMYDPVHLEMLEGAQDRPTGSQNHELTRGLNALRIQFERGDFFLCASERQRDLWLGYMSALGRVNFATYAQDNTLRKLIAVAPFGIDRTPPTVEPRAIKGIVPGISEGDTVLLWAGGVYNWFDPVTLIEAVGDLAATVPQLRLVFLGTKHPSLHDLSTTTLQQARNTAERCGLLGKHVFFLEGWVPYAERGRYLADADIGVSSHLLHVETAFSFRTRMLDYLWAGLPIVCTEGDEFARIVAEDGLGRVVGAQDRDGWVRALRELLADPAELRRCRAAADRTAEQFHWRVSLAPLVEYCADPWRAADSRGSLRPIGRVARWGSRIDDRLSHWRAVLSSEGIRGLAVRAIRAPIKMVVRPVLRHLPGRVKARVQALPDHQRARIRRLVG